MNCSVLNTRLYVIGIMVAYIIRTSSKGFEEMRRRPSGWDTQDNVQHYRPVNLGLNNLL